MAFCLTENQVNRFKQALVNGEIDPESLSKMTSQERQAAFTKLAGEENAKQVNALFESKLLLKNQQAGMISWAKKVTGITPEARRDLFAKIERLDKALSPDEQEMFMKDLVETRLGVSVSSDEAKTISNLSQEMQNARAKVDPETLTFKSESDRMKYGMAATELNDYVLEKKVRSKALKFVDYLKQPKEVLYGLAGAAKSIVASLDNSFFGRQGIKTLYTNPDIWAKNFVKSWGDIGKEMLGRDAMAAIKADVFSRPNALNGKYKIGKFDLGIFSEEAFPSALPERIPILGRVYKASESAYNGAAMRIRADLADRVIATAEKNGVNTLDRMQAESLGKLVNSLTGRGSIGKAEPIGKELNALFFSIKFLKSNFDSLTMHTLDRNMSGYAKKEAAKNLLKIVGSTAGLLGTASVMWPGSVEWDPRSSDFGKIRIGNTRFDITGGMGSLVTLASRLIPTGLKDGKPAWYTKSTTTGEVKQLNTGEYGSQTSLDVLESFLEGKLSPSAGVFRDLWKGEMYGGEPVTVTGELQQIGTPLITSTGMEAYRDPNSANNLLVIVADALGFSANTYGGKAKPLTSLVGSAPDDMTKEFDRLSGTGNAPSTTGINDRVDAKNLQKQISADRYNQFLKDFQDTLKNNYQKVMMDVRYLNMSDEQKKKALDSAKNQTYDYLLKKYNYKEPEKKKGTNIDLYK